MPDKTQFNQLLDSLNDGDESALAAISEIVYSELRRLANLHMMNESPGHTLQATALVNEAFMRMLGPEIDYQDKNHFLAIAGSMMRRILIDHARSKYRFKRGGGQRAVTLDDYMLGEDAPSVDILSLDAALNKLEEYDARKAKVIEQQYFAGMSHQQIADNLGVNVRTVERDAKFSRVWLLNQMS